MRLAVTRQVSAALERCELTHVERSPIDAELARRQHAGYEALLAELGCRVRSLEAEPELPDSVFVEDVAVVLDELAIITRPGARSRRAETAGVAAALRPHRQLSFIEPPGTLDGGDVLRVDRELWVGRSRRTNRQAIEQLRALAGPHGYEVREVAVGECLHLKSGVSEIGGGRLLVNPDLVGAAAFTGVELIPVDPAEPWGANVLRIGDVVVAAAHHPRTRRRLEAEGVRVRPIEVSELAKAEGGVTCCSLIFESPPGGGSGA